MCSSCLYRLSYDKHTRDRILTEVDKLDAFVQCHCHAHDAHVCCAGYYAAVGERGGTPVQLAIRLTAAGLDVIEWVEPAAYPTSDDEEE